MAEDGHCVEGLKTELYETLGCSRYLSQSQCEICQRNKWSH